MTAPAPTATLDALREQRDTLLMRREIATLETYVGGLEQLNRVVHESYGYGAPGFGEYVGNDPLRGDPHYQDAFASYPIDLIGDREGGMDRPVFQNETDLARIRGIGRWLVNEIPPAIAVERNLVNYVIGSSWSYEATAKDDADATLAEEVNGFIEDWIEHNEFVGSRDREIYRRSVRDGEAFVTLRPAAGGLSDCRFEEPSFILEPADKGELEAFVARRFAIPVDQHASDWTFGVHRVVNDERVFGYHVVRDGAGRDWDYLPDSHVEHFRSASTDRNVKRGISEFWPVERHLRKGDKVFTATADGSAVQARIAWIRELAEGHQRSTVTPVDGYVPIPSQGATRQVQAVNYTSPVALTVPAGQKYQPGPMGSQRNPNLILAGQAVLRLAGTRWCMPEWMVSGDASNNNFASSLVAESPFVKSAEAEQHTFKRSALSLLWKAIRIAAEFGRFSVASFAELRRRLMLNATPPTIATRDPLQKSQQDEIDIRTGKKSRRTAAQEDGLNFDEQTANMDSDGDAAFRQQGPQASPAEFGALVGALNTAESLDDVRAITESMLRRYP